MPKNILTIDVGHSAVKVSVYAPDGRCLFAQEKECPPTLAEDRDEQDAEKWRQAVNDLMRAASREVPSETAAIEAIGITGTMRSIVLVDKHNNPVGPAILFQDRRAEAQYEKIQNEISPARILSLTGQRLSPRSVPARLRWIAENEPERLKNTRFILAPKDFIRLHLTGIAATDPTDAAALQLYSLRENKWHEALCNCAGISSDILPPVQRSTETAGSPSRASAGPRTGLQCLRGFAGSPGAPCRPCAASRSPRRPAAAGGADGVCEACWNRYSCFCLRFQPRSDLAPQTFS